MSGQLPFSDPPQDGVLTDLEMPGYVSKDGPWFGSGHAPGCQWLLPEVGRARLKQDGSEPILGKGWPMRRRGCVLHDDLGRHLDLHRGVDVHGLVIGDDADDQGA